MEYMLVASSVWTSPRLKSVGLTILQAFITYIVMVAIINPVATAAAQEENIVMDVPSGSKRIGKHESEAYNVYSYKVLSSDVIGAKGRLTQKVLASKPKEITVTNLNFELIDESHNCKGNWTSYKVYLQSSDDVSVSRECVEVRDDKKRIVKYQSSRFLLGNSRAFLVSIDWNPPSSQKTGWSETPEEIKAETQKYLESVRLCNGENELSCQHVLSSFLKERLKKSFEYKNQ